MIDFLYLYVFSYVILYSKAHKALTKHFIYVIIYKTKGGEIMAKKRITMNEKHIVRIALALSGDTIKTAGEKTGIHPNVLSSQLNRYGSTMTLTSLYSLLNAIGFEIVVRDKDKQYGGKEFVFSDISESSSEWDKILAIEKASAEIRKIEEKKRDVSEEESARKAAVDAAKAENAESLKTK